MLKENLRHFRAVLLGTAALLFAATIVATPSVAQDQSPELLIVDSASIAPRQRENRLVRVDPATGQRTVIAILSRENTSGDPDLSPDGAESPDDVTLRSTFEYDPVNRTATAIFSSNDDPNERFYRTFDLDSGEIIGDTPILGRFRSFVSPIYDVDTSGISANTDAIAVNSLAIDTNTQAVSNLSSRLDGVSDQVEENTEGIALALALEDPVLFDGQTFAMRGNLGFFEGESAVGLSAFGRVGKNLLGQGETIAVGAGIGLGNSHGTVGGRVGVQIGW